MTQVDLKEAILYTKENDDVVQCNLCSHRCRIKDNQFGICGMRQNIKGKLLTHNYGKIVAAHIDPIEKKPLFHFFPGTSSYSFACIGCNFHCAFCQNWQISQKKEAEKHFIPVRLVSAQEIVEAARQNYCPSISYTYTEPTIFFEFALEVMQLAKEKGLYNVFVTNGFMSPECLALAKDYLDAANVDLKSFRQDFYRQICGANLAPVLENIKLMYEYKIWIEITTLVIPGLNDSLQELKDIATFIAGIDKDIPWHISRFHPEYKMSDYPVTPLQKLKEAFAIGKEAGLHYVYIGNIMEEENTYCYNCGQLLIRRFAFGIEEYNLKTANCPKCSAAIKGKGLA